MSRLQAEAELCARAPAKVNLYLHVTGRRAGGYHLLDSLVTFAAAADEIFAAPSNHLTLEVTGPFAAMCGAPEDNLAMKAARLLQAETGTKKGASLRLVKNIPAGAGLGGGSADAAAALTLLNRLWRLGIDRKTLAALGGKLGADIPVCLRGGTVWMSGIGDMLEGAPPLPPLHLLLVYPGAPVSSREVYARGVAAFSPAVSRPESWNDAAALLDFLISARNDLEPSALAIAPITGEVLAALRAAPGCMLVRMSGSGSACFGLFRTEEQRLTAARAIRTRHPWWWII